MHSRGFAMDAGLKNKVILITGASGAIGSVTARAFAAEGARLILHYNSRRVPVEKLRDEIQPDAPVIRADLTRETDVKNLFKRAIQSRGRVDTLIANAGIWIEKEMPIHRMALAQWEKTIRTDLTSTFLVMREFFKCVEKQKQGNAVMVGSTAGVFGEAGHGDYAAAKSAMAYGLVRTLKNEISRLAPHTKTYCGGRINCVCPGWVVTPMTASHLDDHATVRKVTSTMALPQLARPGDIANTLVYLSSDRLARHVTGQTLVIAGGMEGRVLWHPTEIDPSIA